MKYEHDQSGALSHIIIDFEIFLHLLYDMLRGLPRRVFTLFYFIFQLLVQKHKIFNIKGVSKVSFTCGYSH